MATAEKPATTRTSIQNARTVASILHRKGNDVLTVTGDKQVQEAAAMMARHKIGCLVVVDAGGHPVGLITERDIVGRLAVGDGRARMARIDEVMQSSLVMVQPSTRVHRCMELVTKHRVRYLVVMRGEQLAGVVSVGDVIKAVMEEQDFLIDQLGSYITGAPM